MGDRDTWTNRDLPVLRAVVDIYEDDDDDNIEPDEVRRRTGFDEATVQRALRNLHRGYLDNKGETNASGDYYYIGEPTADGLRAAENWPSPESIVARLVAALEQAADDAEDPEERNRLKTAARAIAGTAYQVALGVLSGAGGNMLSG
jgi:predicted transcriptional regulator